MASDEAAANVRIQGRVQGVGYRYFVLETATSLGLLGWVRNLPNGDVEAQAEGSKASIELWLEQLKGGPPLSRVERIQVDWLPCENRYKTFYIKP